MMFKMIVASILGVVAAVAATSASAQSAPPVYGLGSSASSELRPYWIDHPVIEIIGSAQMDFQPNRARITVQLEAMDANADRAQIAVSDRARAAVARVQALAGSKARISAVSTREEVYEQYRTRDGTRVENERSDKVEFYINRWTITVILDDLTLVPTVRGELLSAGNARELAPVSFWFEPSPAQSRAVYEAAVQDGMARADIAARAAGGARLRLVTLQEGQTDCLSVRMEGDGIHDASASLMMAPMAAPPPPPSGAATRRLTATDVTLPADPPTTRLEARVCMIYAVERPS